MKYNFDELTERRNTGAIKWDIAENELPMWVADMDFKTAPSVLAAIEKRAAHGIFGYSYITDEWYTAIRKWWGKRHSFEVGKDWLIFSAGVMPSVSSIIRRMTCAGENILVQPPVYNMFFNAIADNGRNVVENRLVFDGAEYHMDFADLEEKLSDPQTSMMILCNPHNPVGKIWDRETLGRVGDLCKKYHVLVLSDEIHCDLAKPGCGYVPFASVSDDCRKNSITCIAPTKTFNIAGIQTSAVIVPDENIRHRVLKGLDVDGVAEPNAFAVDAAVAAYEDGEEWLDELCVYLWDNRKAAEEYIDRHMPFLKPIKAEATYLMWIDARTVYVKGENLAKKIRDISGLFLSDGSAYRDGGGFLRLNLACPRERLMDGLKRLKESADRLKEDVGRLKGRGQAVNA